MTIEMKQELQVLTPELLESMLPNSLIPKPILEQTHPNVLVLDPATNELVECEIWIYTPGVYTQDKSQATVMITVKSIRNKSYYAIPREKRGEVRYEEYFRHLRIQIPHGPNAAINTKSTVIEALKTKQYTIG